MNTKTDHTTPETEAREVMAAQIAAPTDVLAHLRDAGREPIRIWKAKGPKGVLASVEGILCQDTNEILLATTTAGGKFTVYVKQPA